MPDPAAAATCSYAGAGLPTNCGEPGAWYVSPSGRQRRAFCPEHGASFVDAAGWRLDPRPPTPACGWNGCSRRRYLNAVTRTLGVVEHFCPPHTARVLASVPGAEVVRPLTCSWQPAGGRRGLPADLYARPGEVRPWCPDHGRPLFPEWQRCDAPDDSTEHARRTAEGCDWVMAASGRTCGRDDHLTIHSHPELPDRRFCPVHAAEATTSARWRFVSAVDLALPDGYEAKPVRDGWRVTFRGDHFATCTDLPMAHEAVARHVALTHEAFQ